MDEKERIYKSWRYEIIRKASIEELKINEAFLETHQRKVH